MPDVLRSFSFPGSIEDPLTPRWAARNDKTTLGEAWRMEFDSEPELELSLAALGYECDGEENKYGFRYWRRMAR